MSRIRTGLAGVLLVVPTLALACNGILGIDAPTLVEGGRDASSAGDRTMHKDGPEGADGGKESSPMTDGSVPDAPRSDAKVDSPVGDGGLTDARPDDAPAFDGHCACPDGSICDPVALVSGQPDPRRIFVDPVDGVFWANPLQTTGSIWHTSLTGTGTRQLASGQSVPDALRYGHGVVFWIDDATSELVYCTAVACTATVVASEQFGAGATLLVAAGSLFASNGIFGRIDRFNLIDGSPGPDASSSAFATGLGSPVSMAIDSENLYWTESSRAQMTFDAGPGVFSCPLGGCTGHPSEISIGSNPEALVVDDTSVYWVDTSGIYTAPIAGGVTSTLVPISAITGTLATDGTSLYAATPGGVVRVSKDGSSVVTLTSVGHPSDVAVAGSCVYWVDDSPDAGHVYASAK